MNKRTFLTRLLTLLPFVGAASILAKYYPPSTPVPTKDTFPNRFSFEVREFGERYDVEGNLLLPCFRATIRDHVGPPYQCGIQSAVFTNTDERRQALRGLYENIAYITQRRQWPDDTLVYDQVETATGYRLINPRYPV